MTEKERQKLMRYASSIMPAATASSCHTDFLSREHAVAKILLGAVLRAVDELKFNEEDLCLALELAYSDVEQFRRHHYQFDDIVFRARKGVVKARWKTCFDR